MREVMAGFLVGYALSFVTSPLLALVLMRTRARSPALALAVPQQVPVVALAVALYWFVFMLWAAVGVLLGLALDVLNDSSPQGGLGSPNLAFTLLILGGTLAVFSPPFFLMPSVRRQVLAAGVVFAGAFGWLMPHLAQWSRFGLS
jgi:hypothetical protein